MSKELKISVKQARRLFTIAHKEYCDNERELSIVNRISCLKLIQEKAKLMLAKEHKYREYLFQTEESEEIIENEIDESESYLDKWRLLEIKLADLIFENREKSIISDANSGNQANSLLNYPQLKLPNFDGNIKNWLSFWGQFQKIDCDSCIDDHDKFAYLSQSMVSGTAAADLVNSFPPSGKSYKKALDQLKNRYGRDELLVEIYVRDLLHIVAQKDKTTKTSLRKLFDQIETKVRALETLGVTSEKYAAILYPLIESCLPTETLRAWERCRATLRRSSKTEAATLQNCLSNRDLNNLLDFLQDEAEGEERISVATQGFSGDKAKKKISFDDVDDSQDRKDYSHVPTATELLISTKQKRISCLFCKGEHKIWNCLKGKSLPLNERQNAVEKARLCFRCLKKGHRIKNCTANTYCRRCKSNHNTFLCRNFPKRSSIDCIKSHNECEVILLQDNALTSSSPNPKVFLQTLSVILRGNGEEYEARAIIDTGSQRSYILKSTAAKCKYVPTRQETLSHNVFGSHKKENTKHNVHKIHLKSIDGNYFCNFDVFDQPVICDQVPSIGHGPWTEELKTKNIHLTDIKRNPRPIELLIGADICGKLLTGERFVLSSGLVAINTLLGWTLIGKVPNNTTSMMSISTLRASVMKSNSSTTNSYIVEASGTGCMSSCLSCPFISNSRWGGCSGNGCL